MSTRSTLGLIYMVRGLRHLGIDPSSVLRRHGLSADDLDPLARIDRTREWQLYAELAGTVQDPLGGLKLGEFYGLGGYGPLTMLLMTCATALDALKAGVQYQGLTYLFATLSLENACGMTALVLDPSPLDGAAFRFRIDGEVSGTFKLLRDMQSTMGMQMAPVRVDLPYPRPAQAPDYERYFGCPVRFGQAFARIWMPDGVMGLPLPSADPDAHAIYRQTCDQQLSEQQQLQPTVAQQVMGHLRLFKGQFPGAADVARSLNLSERGLRRQLSEEGHSFRDLLGQVRYEKARHLLRHTRLPVEEIAQQTGYAEAAAFTHAFQRWSGMSPSAYRLP